MLFWGRKNTANYLLSLKCIFKTADVKRINSAFIIFGAWMILVCVYGCQAWVNHPYFKPVLYHFRQLVDLWHNCTNTQMVHEMKMEKGFRLTFTAWMNFESLANWTLVILSDCISVGFYHHLVKKYMENMSLLKFVCWIIMCKCFFFSRKNLKG